MVSVALPPCLPWRCVRQRKQVGDASSTVQPCAFCSLAKLSATCIDRTQRRQAIPAIPMPPGSSSGSDRMKRGVRHRICAVLAGHWPLRQSLAFLLALVVSGRVRRERVRSEASGLFFCRVGSCWVTRAVSCLENKVPKHRADRAWSGWTNLQGAIG